MVSDVPLMYGIVAVFVGVPWVPEVFLACGGNFCPPKADTGSAAEIFVARRPT